jgi:hypothetical protein
MSAFGSSNTGGMPKGVQGPSAVGNALATAGLQGAAQGIGGSASGADVGPMLLEVRRTADRLRNSLGSSVEVGPMIAGLVEVLRHGPNRVTLAAIDEFQALYGLLAVKVAEGYLDVREDKDKQNRSHNTGKEVEEFLENVGMSAGQSWCAAFVYTCHAEAAALLGGFTSTPKTALASAVWVNGRTTCTRFTAEKVYAGEAIPRAGDLFVFEQTLDTAGRATKAREAALKKATNDRRDRLAVATKDAQKDPALVAGLDAKKKWIEEQYAKAVAAAEAEHKKRTQAMREGVLLGNNLGSEKTFWADPKAGKSGSHTGLVKAFDPATNRLVTIEGNTSDGTSGSTDGDGVYERTDRMDRRNGNKKYPQMYGFVRPKFRPA